LLYVGALALATKVASADSATTMGRFGNS
jgi:hypothetical protein